MRISDWSSDVCSSDLHVAALPDQPGEGFPAGHFVRVQARDILDQRGLDGVGVVARGKDGTGHRVDVLPCGATYVGNDAVGGEAQRARDDLESSGGALGAAETRHDAAALATGRQYVGHVGGLPCIAQDWTSVGEGTSE